MSTPSLFDAFPSISAEEWQQALEKTLKGRPTSSLNWDTGEGFMLKPYYRQADMGVQEQAFPAKRGGQFNAADTGWQAVEEMQMEGGEWESKIAQMAEAEIHSAFLYQTGGELPTPIGEILSKFPLQQTALHLSLESSPSLLAADIYMALSTQRVKADLLTGTLTNDPINKALASGRTPSTVSLTHIEAGVTAFSASPWFRGAGLDLQYIAEQGGTLTQQLAVALASVVAYFDFLEQSGSEVSKEQLVENLAVTFAVGTSFPLEIAKLRAFRMLFVQLLDSYKIEAADEKLPFIRSRISPWHYANYDPHNNLLRATTAAMAAIIGGTQALSIPPFDILQTGGTTTSARLARNIQHLLTHESYLDRVTDPAGGSFYIEQATLSLAEAAWGLFQQIEGAGGLLAAAEKGLISAWIQESAAKKQAEIAKQKRVQVGVNKYPNAKESYPELAVTADDLRAAAPFERLRQRADTHAATSGKRLKAFLLLFGDVRMRNARSQFARNLLGVAGMEVLESQSPNEVEKGIKEALESRPNVIVLCSSDADALAQGPGLVRQLRDGYPDAALFLAGKPEGWENLGVDDTIAARMNVLTFLNGWLDKWIK